MPSQRPSQNGSGGRASLRLGPNVVWNGKVLDWPLENPNKNGQMRYGSVRVEGLYPGEYELNALGYGLIKPGDKFPLPPGECVTLTLVAHSQREATCDFEVFLYKHDANSPQDSGSLIGGKPEEYHWLPPPTEQDISVELNPETVRLRPWHRWGFGSPKARITVSNWSYMELGVKPQVHRGDTPGQGTQVSSLPEYALAPEKSVTLPVTVRLNSRERNENFALWANAQVTPPNDAAQPFTAPCKQQTFVDYVPFKQLWWYDYPLLIGGAWLLICALVWLFWGAPEKAEAVVDLHLTWPTELHFKPGQMQVELLSHGDAAGIPRFYKYLNNDTYRFVLPKRWIGYRWPLGWNGLSQEPQHYDVLPHLPSESQGHFEPPSPTPIDIGYASERRKFHDHNYIVPKDVLLDLKKLPEKPKEKTPTVQSPINPGHLPPSNPGQSNVKDSSEGKQGAPSREHHSVSPKPTPIPNVPHAPSPTPEQKAIKELCARAELPLRTGNPLGIALEVYFKDADKPSVASFEFPKKVGCFQLYCIRGGPVITLLSYMKNDMMDAPRAVVRKADPTQGDYEMAWKNSDLTIELPHDDAGESTDIEYILLAVAADVPVSDDDRKDLRRFVAKLGPDSPKWAVTSWKGHRTAANMPFTTQ